MRKGWVAHGIARVANLVPPWELAKTMDLKCFMSPDPNGTNLIPLIYDC